MREKKRIRAGGRAWARAGMLLLGCTLAPAAAARDGNVFTPYGSLSLTMDDNLFRLPANLDVATVSGKSQRGDLITSTQEGVRGDRFFGRQRLSFDASLNQARYRTYDYLNADLVNASGTWAWQFGNDLHGEVGSEYLQMLTGFADIRSAERNITDTRNDRVTIDYSLHPAVHLVGGLYQTVQDNSAASRKGGDFTTQSVDAGASFMPSSGNHVTLRARKTRAEYPVIQPFFGVPVSNNFDESALGAEGLWQISGKSQLSGLLAYTRRHYGDLSQRDYNGPTGNIYWGYQASGKTTLSLAAKREIGAYFDVTNNYILTDSVTFTSTYQATAKTQLQTRLDHRTRSFLGDPGFILSNAPRRVDRTNSVGLTLNYDVAWPLRVTASLQRELRASNTPGFDYADSSATLALQLTW
ncbi:MAG: hypothetical protein JWN73_1346 [Betaproteobacteria bacterium]|nr:hypothetical protein [Betaproteobacteria bacterium]